MSASCATDEVMRGIIHGAVDYLLKPVRIEAWPGGYCSDARHVIKHIFNPHLLS